MPVDSSTISGILKRIYDDGDIESVQNMETEIWKKIEVSSKKPKGEGFFFPVTVSGNQRGQGSQNELEALRSSDSQDPQQGRILPKIFTHTIRFSGLSAAIAEGDEDSFADNLTYQYEEGMKDAAKELNAQTFRDGLGRIARLNGAVSASTTVTFDEGVPTHFRIGMFVDVINATAVKQIDSIEVTAVDISASTITLASAQSADDNSYIYREDVNDNAPTDGKELAGFALATDDGTDVTVYENISRATFNQWDGIELPAGSANISNDFLQRMRSRAKIIGGKKMKKLASNTSQMRKYLDIIVPSIRHTTEGMLDSQYEMVPTWNGMEWVEDTDCQFDTLIMWDPMYFKKYQVRALKLDDTDGNTVKWDSGFDAFISYMKYYGNLGTQDPHGIVRATGLATPTY